MPRVRYIGNNVKTDSIAGVGLQWAPGQVRDVTATVAAHLLSYTDTWVPESEPEGTPAEALKEHAEEPIGFREEEKRAEEPLAVVDFHSMTKDAMQKYAKQHWNMTLDKKMSESHTRETIIKEHSKREMEDKDI
jgi:hypothetical protein